MLCDFEQCQLADIIVTPKGGKQAPLCQGTLKTPFLITPPMKLIAPFGPGVYEGATNTARQNLDFQCPPELEAWALKFDEWAVKYIAANSERLFGKKLQPAQVKDSLRPLATKKSKEYKALLRTKLQTTGPMRARFWNERGEAIEPPANWRNCEFKIRAHVRSLYVMGKDFGFVTEVTDIQVFEKIYECPFETTTTEGDCPM